MKPGKLDLPTIWRGCHWGPVTLTWKDTNGNPMNLTGWLPFVRSVNVNLNPEITDPVNGITTLHLSASITATLKLGVEQWDWLWIRNDGLHYTPFLSGSVPIRQPISSFSFNGSEGAPIIPPDLP